MDLPPVLDACCATRAFWFDKTDSRTIYLDIREGIKVVDTGHKSGKGRSPRVIKPDVLGDFRQMPFPDETFWHVVFDPPHLHKSLTGNGGIFGFNYGILKDTWREDLASGFKECFRVLKPQGTLIFKWCESEIPLKEVLALTPEKPLYGHRSGKKAQTIWVAFMKDKEK